MASCGILLDRYETWEDHEPNEWQRRPTPSPATVNPELNVTGLSVIPSIWSEAWLEFQLAETVGFWYGGLKRSKRQYTLCSAVWMISLILYAMSFKFYMAIMVLPNLFVLCFALVVSLIVAGERETVKKKEPFFAFRLDHRTPGRREHVLPS